MMKFVNEATLVLELAMEDLLLFLVKLYFKPVLYYTSEICHYKVDLYNIRDELYQIGTEV